MGVLEDNCWEEGNLGVHSAVGEGAGVEDKEVLGGFGGLVDCFVGWLVGDCFVGWLVVVLLIEWFRC